MPTDKDILNLYFKARQEREDGKPFEKWSLRDPEEDVEASDDTVEENEPDEEPEEKASGARVASKKKTARRVPSKPKKNVTENMSIQDLRRETQKQPPKIGKVKKNEPAKQPIKNRKLAFTSDTIGEREIPRIEPQPTQDPKGTERRPPTFFQTGFFSF